MDSLLDRITIDPDLCNGKPTLRGKRITAQTILDYLNAGEARDEILTNIRPWKIKTSKLAPPSRRR